MTKLSSEFCFQIKKDADPDKMFWLGFLMTPLLKDIDGMDNGVEIIRSLSIAFPEIEILKE